MIALPSVSALDGMAGVRGHDGGQTRPDHLRRAIDGDFQLARDDFVDLLFGVEMLVYGGAALEIVMREGHGSGMKVASVPAG
jgi:hypothetical protein